MPNKTFDYILSIADSKENLLAGIKRKDIDELMIIQFFCEGLTTFQEKIRKINFIRYGQAFFNNTKEAINERTYLVKSKIRLRKEIIEDVDSIFEDYYFCLLKDGKVISARQPKPQKQYFKS